MIQNAENDQMICIRLKKLFLVFAIAGALVACNSSSDTSTSADTTTVTTDTATMITPDTTTIVTDTTVTTDTIKADTAK